MTMCPSLGGAAGMSSALRSLDCRTGEATAYAFGRLFGADGRLLPALTLILTLYVAFFAIGLLTGRSRLGVGTLTPRMMTLGLVLTFATSWAAYQHVVWTLATGAPDQIATIVAGTRGSATTAFADRLDRLFAAVADVADAAEKPAAATATGITPATPMVGGFTSATVLWLSALMLLLGTVGVLVTAKIALAAMLALGPVFIVLALFDATRGLFEGWCKAVVLFACVPLFSVLLGSAAVVSLEPIVRGIAMEGGQISTRAVGVLFLGAAVYLALMVMALKAATTLVSGWHLPGSRDRRAHDRAVGASMASSAVAPSGGARADVATAVVADDRVRGIIAALPAPGGGNGAVVVGPSYGRTSAQIIRIGAARLPEPKADRRATGVGSRFRQRPDPVSRERLS